MTRKRKPLPILENVTIEAVAAEGKCVAHVNEMAVFVSFVVPLSFLHYLRLYHCQKYRLFSHSYYQIYSKII